MYGEMMDFYGLSKDFDKADFFETDAFRQTLLNLKAAVRSGGIVALTGIVGSGKTTALRQIHQSLKEDGLVLLAKSLATDKQAVNIATLYTALFADLPTGKDFKPNLGTEKRERALQGLIRKLKKPIVLTIDDAHDLDGRTLIGLKQLVETVQGAGGTITILAAGHPKLSIDLNRASLEEVGARTKVFQLDGLGPQRREFIEWVLANCCKAGAQPPAIFTEAAVEFLAERLITPLQISYYLSRALAKGVLVGANPVDVDLVKTVLSPDLDGLEARLARNGYGINALCGHLGARRAEVRAYLAGQLPPGRAEDFNKEIHKLGVL
ncbi:ExeA family protein [Pseudomonas helleri]|uniref:ExeA family protein n=1 Tax=Pseudomonas helleri TaxID=1608996 RepID=UPI003FCF86C5